MPVTTSAAASSTTLSPIDRHRQALDRRRAMMARDRERGAWTTILDGHQVAIDRLLGLIARAEERAAAEAECADVEARLAAKGQREDAAALQQCGVIIDRIQRRAVDARTHRRLETPADRRLARLARLNPHTERDAAIQRGRGVVPDPYSPGAYESVTVNRRVDVLAQERSTGRITEAEFMVGRMIQSVLERTSGVRISTGGWGQGGSRDQTIAHELAILYRVRDAQNARKFMTTLEQAIGGVGVRFLRAILVENRSFASYAIGVGRGGERAATDVAKRFRWLLKSIVEEQHTSCGAEGQRIRAYRAPAEEVEAAEEP